LFPWTLRGVGILALSIAAVWFWGFGEIDLLLLALGATGIAAVTLATLLVGFGALRVRRNLRAQKSVTGPPRRLETGGWIATGLTVPDWRAIPWLELEVDWIDPTGAEARLVPRDGALVEEVRPQARWLQPNAIRSLVVRDVFGLTSMAVRDERALSAWVLPAVGRLRETPIVTALTGADGISWPSGVPEGDRMEIRRYAPGDSARDVMWNVFARTRNLHVRLRERAVDPSRRLVAYLVAGAGDEASAAAARVALETGGLGDEWTFGADGTPGSQDEPAAALEAVARSGGFQGDCGLGRFLDGANLGEDTACVVFAPPRLDRWLPEVVRVLSTRAGRISVIIGVDRLQPLRPHRAAWHRFAFEVPEHPGEIPEEVHEVARTLAPHAAAAPLLVVRATGRSQVLTSRDLAEKPQGKAAQEAA
jgi:uncharacterized protein (DUF58 family)